MTQAAGALLKLADELGEARAEFLDAFGDLIPQAKAKQRLLQLLWDDKFTIIQALRQAASQGSAGGERSAVQSDEVKLTYIKRWRTIVPLPAKYADEIAEALRAPAQAPIGYAAYSPAYGWRVDLAAKDEQIATAVVMRSISSAAQQGWEIRPIYGASPLPSADRA